MPSIRRFQIQKFQNQAFQTIEDALAIEEPLEIRVAYGNLTQRQKFSLTVTMRTPGNDEDLATGFLLSEGIIETKEDIIAIEKTLTRHADSVDNILLVQLSPTVDFDASNLQRHFYTNASCGVCGKTNIDVVSTKSSYDLPAKKVEITPEILMQLPEKLKTKQSLFTQTGGIHAAALFDFNGNLKLIREDIGRHNAVDKLIGAALKKEGLPLHDYLIVVSGRAGFELVQKSMMAGIPMLAAVGAPSSLAIDLARDCGMQLVGFLKERGFNLY